MEEHNDGRHTLHDYWHIIWEKKWMIALFVFTTTLTVIIGNFLTAPVYEASVMLHIKRQTSSVLGGDLIGSGISGLSTKEEINTQIQILKSRSVLEKVITELDLIDKFKIERILNEEERLQFALDKLRKDISINQLTNTRLLRVSIRSTNPELARDIVNFISHAFIDRNVESKRGEATAVLAFVSSQLALVSEKLNIAEEALLKYKQSEGIGVLSDEAKFKVDRMAQLESSYQETKVERDILATRIRAVLKQIEPAGTTDIEGTMGSLDVTPVNSALKMKLTELKSRDIELRAAEDALTDFIKTLEENINKLPAQEINLIRLERARRINDKLYATLTEARNEAQLESASKMGNIDIIDTAVSPLEAVYPKKKENVIIGFVISLLIGLSLALILEYLDNTVKSEEEVRKILDTPILGLIPQYNSDNRSHWIKRKINPNGFTLETLDNPMSSTSEAFRLLGVNVNFADLDKGLKTIVITSPLPGDGKTTIASNLAIILAAREEKVLIVDADFRLPAIHRIFQFPNSSGLTNILSESTDYKHVLRKIKGADNLDILTCGPIPPNPSEILGSRRMKDFIDGLRADYDRIIFDTPPVFGATDVLVLASTLDGVLMVLKAGKIDKKIVRRTREVFNTANIKIIGSILNGTDVKDGGFGYGYY